MYQVDDDSGVSSLSNESVIGFTLQNLLFQLLFDELVVGSFASLLGARTERILHGEHVIESHAEAPRIGLLRIWGKAQDLRCSEMHVAVDSSGLVVGTDHLGITEVHESRNALIGLVCEHDVVGVEMLEYDSIAVKEVQSLRKLKSYLLESAVDRHEVFARHPLVLKHVIVEGDGLVLR